MTAGEACNREVVVIDRGASILEGAKLMRQHHVGDLVITEDRAGGTVPVGIFTDRDMVVELIAAQVDLEAVSLGDVMSFELATVQEDVELDGALELMRSKGVRRMPVVKSDGTLAGILAADDLVELMAEQLSSLAGLFREQERHEQRRRP